MSDADLDDLATAPPSAPPPPRAPAVLNHLRVSEQALAALKADIATRAMAASEGKPGGREAMAALHQKITAAEFEIACNGEAHELAQRLDKQAVIDWKAAIQAMPEEDIVAGISLTACCGLCSADHGCVISRFSSCAHPAKVGGLKPGQQGIPEIRRVYVAACKKLAGGDEEEEEEYEYEEENQE